MSSFELGALLFAVFLGYALFEYAIGRFMIRSFRAIFAAIVKRDRKTGEE